MTLKQGYKTCMGCMEPIVTKSVLEAIENPVVVSLATGCLEVASTSYPDSSWTCPTIHSAFGNSAATISGIETAFNVLKRKGEIKENPKFIVIAGDGGTYDIGFQAMSGAFERGHDFVYLCLDNGAYMNTGGQRSSASPYKSKTSTTPGGKVQWRKDLTKIALAHNIPYVAQASVADLEDLKQKAKKAFETKGPAFLNVLVPCPRFWRYDLMNSKKINDLSFQTCFWPIFEVENGKKTVKVPENKIPVEEFLKIQGRFKNLTKEDIDEIQQGVDKKWEELNN